MGGELTVLSLRLDDPRTAALDWNGSLAPGERERAARFRFVEDRRRFEVARGLTRRVLGLLTDTPARDVPIGYGSHGKPGVPEGPAFNVAHSGVWVLIAFGAEGRVGVDVEVVRPLPDLDRVAERVFHPDERAELATAGDGRALLAAFYRLWTRKEALVKALGGGLSSPLDAVRCTARDVGPGSVLLDAAAVHEDAARWCVRPLALDPTAPAAVAWDRPCGSVRVTRFEAIDWLEGR